MMSSRTRRAAPRRASRPCSHHVHPGVSASRCTRRSSAIRASRSSTRRPTTGRCSTRPAGGRALRPQRVSGRSVGAVCTVDMGKPSPDPDGKIRYDFSSAVAAWPPPAATTRPASARSGRQARRQRPVDLFTFTTTPACTSPSRQHRFGAGIGRQLRGGVSRPAQAASGTATRASPTWATFDRASGTGSGTVSVHGAGQLDLVEPQRHHRNRGSDTLTVSQDGAAPPSAATVSRPPRPACPPRAAAPASPSRPAAGCAWTALASQSWITLGGAQRLGGRHRHPDRGSQLVDRGAHQDRPPCRARPSP